MARIDVNELNRFVSDLFEELGAPEDTAEKIASSLVESDLSGHHSHGVRLVPTYANRIENGEIDPTARPEIVQEDGSTVVIDGRNAFGQVVGREAIAAGNPKARKNNVAMVGIRNATHLARIGEWAERAADAGLAFVALTCNPGSEIVAPPGTVEGRLSTNPVAVGLPSFDALEYPLVLDIATSQVAYGKIRERMVEEKPIPEAWSAPYEGQPDPEPMHRDGPGWLLPLGGHVSGYKGFGLSVMSELLASTVSDGLVSGQPGTRYGNQAVFFLFDPLHFSTQEAIRDRITHFRDYVFSAERSDKVGIGIAAAGDEVLLPGEKEYRERRDQHRHGVSIRDSDLELLRTFAGDRDMESAVPNPNDADIR